MSRRAVARAASDSTAAAAEQPPNSSRVHDGDAGVQARHSAQRFARRSPAAAAGTGTPPSPHPPRVLLTRPSSLRAGKLSKRPVLPCAVASSSHPCAADAAVLQLHRFSSSASQAAPTRRAANERRARIKRRRVIHVRLRSMCCSSGVFPVPINQVALTEQLDSQEGSTNAWGVYRTQETHHSRQLPA